MPLPNLQRCLWYSTADGLIEITQQDLLGRDEPLIILGEAGMGKTELLRWIGQQHDHSYCTATQLRNARPDGRKLLGNASTLVVDALDELSARADGDAVDLVLRCLGDLGYPRFVVACRVADWRNATSVSAIREQYVAREPLVLNLKPLSEPDILEFLAAKLGGDSERAKAVIKHFREANLDGLLGNPQTLTMVVGVALAGPLPAGKADLFHGAADVLRKEHRDEAADRQPDRAAALDAAGAAFAAIVLTGSDALKLGAAGVIEGELQLSEIAALPGAQVLNRVIGSRLFGNAGGVNRLSYWHRSIGEYLGSRWLARQADTAMKRRRLLALFHSYGDVPASLRGLHAWMANHDSLLAPAVIQADPMGVIEYADADALTPAAARVLFDALKSLAARNPNFSGWRHYSMKSIVQPEFLDEIRALINDCNSEFGLRLLLIAALKGCRIAESLRPDLRAIFLDRNGIFALRQDSLEALLALDGEDWSMVIEDLARTGSEDDIRLASGIVRSNGICLFSFEMVIRLVVAEALTDGHLRRVSDWIETNAPVESLSELLDELAKQSSALGDRHQRPGNNELTDLAYRLIGRRLSGGDVSAELLWSWLLPFDDSVGYRRDARADTHRLIHEGVSRRREIQRKVLIEESSTKTIWERSWRLKSRSEGLLPTSEDLAVLLDSLDVNETSDERWREFLTLVAHSATDGVEAREAAKRFVENRPDMLSWIDRLAEPRIPEWQVKREQRERQRLAKQAAKRLESRIEYQKLIEPMRAGDAGVLLNPAAAYIGQFEDLDRKAAPFARLVEWLGQDLAEAALQGFDAYLVSDQPPSKAEVIASQVQSKRWCAMSIVVAAIGERVRSGRGFYGVSDDRLTCAFYELRHSYLDRDSSLETLRPAVEAEMRRRGLIEPSLRALIEPQLEARLSNVDELHALMNSESGSEDAADIAGDWLRRFPDMPLDPEECLIDRLVASHRLETLKELLPSRSIHALSEARQRNWDAVAFFADFEAQHDRLERIAVADKNWLWSLRDRLGGDRGRKRAATLSVAQLAWLMATFRRHFPNIERPRGVTTGNTNPWDAPEFLAWTVNRLADQISDEAIAALHALRDAEGDGYTSYLRALAVEQQRKQTETRFRPPSLRDLRAVVEAQAPRSVADLQSTILEHLELVQRRVAADPVDSWRLFYTDDGEPRDEERCRDHLMTMIGVRPDGIDLMPEGHLAADNRADIIGMADGMRLPIEIKGQWHPELWRAADSQLDRLYATDYLAERRGIYIVLWFGNSVAESKKPRASGRGQARPLIAEELRRGLIEGSQSASEGRIAIVVLDIERRHREARRSSPGI